MRRALVILTLLAAVGLAGCVAVDAPGDASEAGADGDPAPPEVPEKWPSLALAVGDAHDHSDPADHKNLTTPNFEVLGWDPMVTNATGTSSGGYLCGDAATEGDRDLAVVHSYTSDVAFVVVDVTDPDDPRKVGEMVLPRTGVRDIELSSDGSHVAIAASSPDTSEENAPTAALETRTVQPVWRDTCGNTFPGPEEEIPWSNGVLLLDLRDVTDPTIADYAPAPVLGAHSIHATTAGGTDWVLSSVTNLAHSGSYFTFFAVEETMDGLQLRERYVHEAKTPSQDRGLTDQPLVNGHVDGWIEPHPVTGEPVAYLANWDGGLVTLDLSDGPPFEVLGQWTDFDPATDDGDLPYTRSAMTGNIHTAVPIDTTWNGRHYTFVGQEVPSRPPERPTGQMVMLDTTDPGDPEPVARWTLPVDVRWNGFLQFSTHYAAVDEGSRTMLVALYHGGVWAVDVRPSQGPELPTLGAFVPARTSPSPPQDPDAPYAWTPTVMEVSPVGDAFFVPDSTSGAYMVDFHRDVDAEIPQPEPWTKDAWIEDG